MEFFVITLIIGFIFLVISRHYKKRIEQMDAESTGNIIPDQEAEAWYRYGRRINYRIMKATKYMGFLFIFFVAVVLLMFLFEFILDQFAPS